VLENLYPLSTLADFEQLSPGSVVLHDSFMDGGDKGFESLERALERIGRLRLHCTEGAARVLHSGSDVHP
jgi:hypothetical protein